MNVQNPALAQKMRRHLKHVMLLETNPAYARMLADMLRMLGAERVSHFKDDREALIKTEGEHYTLIVSSHQPPECLGVEFIKRLRRSDAPSRKAPVIMIASEATLSLLNEARDAGADEFMRKPFTWGDLLKRVEHVTLKSRPWIEAVGYVGPDRRRFNSGDYSGPRKRAADLGNETLQQIEQSVRILKASYEQYASDPAQARRAMYAQLEVLVPACQKIASQAFREDVKAILAQLKAPTPDLEALKPAIYSLAKFMKIEDRKPPNAA